MNGICTLANDRVYDQLVALLNSIEEIAGPQMPVCVYPYDDNTARIAAEIAKRPQVQLYDDRESIQRWEDFARAAWDTSPIARQRWAKTGSSDYYRLGMHRRFCGFDGPFDRFLYMDGDTLLLSPVDKIFELLDSYDCVVYDYQHQDVTHVYQADAPKLYNIFSPERISTEIFCAGLFASKRGLFPAEKREWLLSQLANGDAEVLYPMAPDQTLLNYMMMRSEASIYNFVLELSASEKTGCCITCPRTFQYRDNILYDTNGKPLTYVHYIGLSSQLFARLCKGENIDFPYRDIFLDYRYLREPQNRPQLKGKAKPYNAPPSFITRVRRKLGLLK